MILNNMEISFSIMSLGRKTPLRSLELGVLRPAALGVEGNRAPAIVVERVM